MAYDHLEIEARWQRYWDEHGTFRAMRLFTDIVGLITHVAFYAGWPCAVNAGRIGIDVFGPK